MTHERNIEYSLQKEIARSAEPITDDVLDCTFERDNNGYAHFSFDTSDDRYFVAKLPIELLTAAGVREGEHFRLFKAGGDTFDFTKIDVRHIQRTPFIAPTQEEIARGIEEIRAQVGPDFDL